VTNPHVKLDPGRYHAKNHSVGMVPFEECWRCQRAKAICRSKRRFGTREAVDERVREINEGNGYTSPVSRYPCRWCPGWHLTSATTRVQVRRTEKQRRKWLRG
jgi:hypothetical protein